MTTHDLMTALLRMQRVRETLRRPSERWNLNGKPTCLYPDAEVNEMLADLTAALDALTAAIPNRPVIVLDGPAGDASDTHPNRSNP